LSKLLAITLGFRTEYQIRFLMRNMPSREDATLVIMPKEPSSQADQARAALEEVRKFMERFFPEVHVEVLEVPLKPPEEGLGLVATKLAELSSKCGEVVLCLSGGMRALVLVTLAAALYAVPHTILRIEVDLEGWGDWIDVKPHFFRIEPLSLDSARILKALLKSPYTLDELREATGIPRTTLYKQVKRMAGYGLIEEMRTGRRVIYRLTPLGRALAGVKP